MCDSQSLFGLGFGIGVPYYGGGFYPGYYGGPRFGGGYGYGGYGWGGPHWHHHRYTPIAVLAG